MLDFGFYNMDCMIGMKEFPDNYFDLAIVDPPYGGGFTEGGGCQGWFAKYHQDNGVGGGTGTGSEAASTGTKRHFTFGLRKTDKNYQIKREQAKEQSKKSFRGTLPRSKTISKNCFVSHVTRLYGGAIILIFRRHVVS